MTRVTIEQDGNVTSRAFEDDDEQHFDECHGGALGCLIAQAVLGSEWGALYVLAAAIVEYEKRSGYRLDDDELILVAAASRLLESPVEIPDAPSDN